MARLFSKLEFSIGCGLLAIITGLVFIAAIMRFFGHPLIWSVDLAQLLFIWVCFIGAARAMRQRVHLGVDFLVAQFPHRIRLIIETGLAVLIITFLARLAVEGYDLTVLNLERLFGDSGLSYAWVTIAVPFGSILLSISILSNLYESWKPSRVKRTLVFTRTPTDSEEIKTEL